MNDKYKEDWRREGVVQTEEGRGEKQLETEKRNQ